MAGFFGLETNWDVMDVISGVVMCYSTYVTNDISGYILPFHIWDVMMSS